MTRPEFEIVEKLVAAAWRRDQMSCQILLMRLAITTQRAISIDAIARRADEIDAAYAAGKPVPMPRGAARSVTTATLVASLQGDVA